MPPYEGSRARAARRSGMRARRKTGLGRREGQEEGGEEGWVRVDEWCETREVREARRAAAV